MKRVPLRLIVSLSCAALSATLLTWGLIAPPHVTRRQVIQPNQMQLPNGQSVPETRLLTLDYSVAIRSGDADRLRLTVEVQEKATATGSANVYETHQVFAETRLEMAGMNAVPAGTVSEPLVPGQSVSFFWSVRPSEVGRSEGTIWLYLRFVPKDGGPEIRQPISAQVIEIESVTLLGVHASAARPLGVLGVFVSVVLGFSYLMEGVRWMEKRRRTKRAPKPDKI